MPTRRPTVRRITAAAGLLTLTGAATAALWAAPTPVAAQPICIPNPMLGISCPPPPPPPPGQPGMPTTAAPPTPGIPSLPDQPGTGGGPNGGAFVPPAAPPYDGTPLIPVPGATEPVLPGNIPPAPTAPPPAPGQPPTGEVPTPPPPAEGEDLVAQLERAARLHEQGVLSDQEFADLKQRLLRSDMPPAPSADRPGSPSTDRPPAPVPEPAERDGFDPRTVALIVAGAAAFTAAARRSGGSTSLGSLLRSGLATTAVRRAPGEDGGNPWDDVPGPHPQPGQINADSARAHILYGDGEGSGGHMSGSATDPGKTEFPEDWGPDRIMRAVEQVANNPDQPPEWQEDKGTWLVKGTVDGVAIEVAIMPDGTVVTAYPTGGPGVTQLDENGDPQPMSEDNGEGGGNDGGSQGSDESDSQGTGESDSGESGPAATYESPQPDADESGAGQDSPPLRTQPDPDRRVPQHGLPEPPPGYHWAPGAADNPMLDNPDSWVLVPDDPDGPPPSEFPEAPPNWRWSSINTDGTPQLIPEPQPNGMPEPPEGYTWGGYGPGGLILVPEDPAAPETPPELPTLPPGWVWQEGADGPVATVDPAFNPPSGPAPSGDQAPSSSGGGDGSEGGGGLNPPPAVPGVGQRPGDRPAPGREQPAPGNSEPGRGGLGGRGGSGGG
ncbi:MULTISPECIES: EndoU domain-containing protein [unclassified Nocardia]|uniref:EndoU domain-containing protein n=1 Tax=unclassified Nocardia TaxID=2637762 RepID=UPI0024A8B717|nr:MULTISPECIES: EndoU domain-containing protein [unclassified Nocardia]